MSNPDWEIRIGGDLKVGKTLRKREAGREPHSWVEPGNSPKTGKGVFLGTPLEYDSSVGSGKIGSERQRKIIENIQGNSCKFIQAVKGVGNVVTETDISWSYPTFCFCNYMLSDLKGHKHNRWGRIKSETSQGNSCEGVGSLPRSRFLDVTHTLPQKNGCWHPNYILFSLSLRFVCGPLNRPITYQKIWMT